MWKTCDFMVEPSRQIKQTSHEYTPKPQREKWNPPKKSIRKGVKKQKFGKKINESKWGEKKDNYLESKVTPSGMGLSAVLGKKLGFC